MESINIEHLVQSEYYLIEYWSGGKKECTCIVKSGGGRNAGRQIYLHGTSTRQYPYYAKGGNWVGDPSNWKIRLATTEELVWIDACIKADELVPMPAKCHSVNNHYSIY